MRTWNLTAFMDRSSLPVAVKLVQSQLKSSGKGLGTFVQNGSVSDADKPAAPWMEGLSERSLLQYVDGG